ncbi:unnamed protein product, partial [Brassica rapa subsp. trilocularis]
MMGVDMLSLDSKCLTEIENRTFTFQLKLTEFNITSKHQSLTISRIFEKHQRPPLPSFAEQSFMLNTFLFYLFLQGSNNQPGEVMPRAGAVSSKPSDTGEASKNAGASDILGIVEGGDADPPIQSDEAVLLTLPLPTNHPRMMCVKGK